MHTEILEGLRRKTELQSFLVGKGKAEVRICHRDTEKLEGNRSAEKVCLYSEFRHHRAVVDPSPVGGLGLFKEVDWRHLPSKVWSRVSREEAVQEDVARTGDVETSIGCDHPKELETIC